MRMNNGDILTGVWSKGENVQIDNSGSNNMYPIQPRQLQSIS